MSTRTAIATLTSTVARVWRPVALTVPEIEPDLIHQGAAHRVAESLQYFFLSVEYWVSPGGRLRAWIALNVLAALVIAVPLALVFPLITRVFSSLSIWSEFAKNIAMNALIAIAFIAAASAVAMVTHMVIVSYIQHVFGGRRR